MIFLDGVLDFYFLRFRFFKMKCPWCFFVAAGRPYALFPKHLYLVIKRRTADKNMKTKIKAFKFPFVNGKTVPELHTPQIEKTYAYRRADISRGYRQFG